MLRLITDFDGPIMDVSERYYRVYNYCLKAARRPHQPTHPLSKAEFWQLKRSRVPEREIGKRSGLDDTQALLFAKLRRQTVHSVPYLIYDSPVPGTVETLERIQQLGIDLVVLTMRKVRELDAALHQHDLGRFFPLNRRYCLSNDYMKSADVEDKPVLMKQALDELPPAAETWMVGDTEADLIAAKFANIKAIAVLSGIRDRHQLAQHHPHSITHNLSEAVDLILHETKVQGYETVLLPEHRSFSAG